LMSSFTDLPMMRLSEGDVPDVIVPESKQPSKVKTPESPKLPSGLALP